MVGQPTLYRDSYNNQAHKLALLGCTDAEMAEFFQVCEATINNWKIDFPQFLESITRGKIIADAEVAHKLYDRATGAEWTEQQAFKVKKGSNNEEVIVVNVKRSAPPDTNAASLWLRNRRAKPNKNSQGWNEKIINELQGELASTKKLDFACELLQDFSTEQLENFQKKLQVAKNAQNIES